MSELPARNRRIVLASRPVGRPQPGDFRMEEQPVAPPAEGQVLLSTQWLSLDPYMRGRMSDQPSYAPPVALGAVMVGGTVCRVVQSRHPGLSEGDLVRSMSGWQEYALADGAGLVKLPSDMARPSLALGVLGMPGFTAYMGLLDIGAPQQGETLVVAAATGPVGSVVGQVAKLHGCRAVGIAGGAEKCRFAVEEFGFDACIDHRAPDFAEQLAAAVPGGIDIYFENVGGKVFAAVVPLLNPKARVPVCGLVSQYNATGPASDALPVSVLMRNVLTKRLRIQGFIIFSEYGHRIDEFETAMADLVESGRVKYREDVVEGLEHAPEALIGMLEGRNFGKVVVKVRAA